MGFEFIAQLLAGAFQLTHPNQESAGVSAARANVIAPSQISCDSVAFAFAEQVKNTVQHCSEGYVVKTV